MNEATEPRETVLETPLYQDANGNIITRSRAVMGGTTYAIHNVTSVSQREQAPNPFGVLMCVLLTIGMLASHLWVLALLAAIGAYFLLKATHRIYSVVIGTASGERSALQSKDLEVTGKIVTALNQAIASR